MKASAQQLAAFTFVLAVGAILSAGCRRVASSAADADASKNVDVADASKNVDVAAPQVTLQILDYDQLQALIESHRGKVVVMDAWSTSCPPCVREFPHLVALHRRYGPDKVACISLSFDYEGLDPPAEVAPPVLAFLKQQQATFDNVLSSVEADTLYKQMNLAAVPAVFVYNADGTLSKRFDNEAGKDFTYADVAAHVASLLDAD